MVSRRFFLKSSGLALVALAASAAGPGALGLCAEAARAARRRWWSCSSAARCDGLNRGRRLRRSRTIAALRPTIALPAPRGGDSDAALDLDGYFGLHPSLEPLLPRWKDGILAACPGRGQPRPDALALRRAGLHGERDSRH